MRLRRRDADLDADTLRAMSHAVSEALRGMYGQSPDFAIDTAEEMVNEAYAEYAEKPAAEQAAIRNLPGLLVTTAIRRSIDKARKYGREIRGEGAQAIIDSTEDQTPSPEALAVRGIEAAEVFEAVAELHHEQRQVLKLIYWEDKTTHEAGDEMGVSAMTIVRRRNEAMEILRERFGVDADDPLDKHLRTQAGYSAWTIFVVGPAALHTALTMGEHLAVLAGRFAGSGGGDAAGAAVGSGSAGGFGRAVCVGVTSVAVLYCGAGYVGIGPGVGIIPGVGGGSDTRSAPRSETRSVLPPPALPPVAQKPTPSHRSQSRPGAGRNGNKRARAADGREIFKRHHDAKGRKFTKEAEHATRNQGLGSQSPDPAPEEPEPEAIPEREPDYVGEAGGGGQGSAETATKEQFGLGGP